MNKDEITLTGLTAMQCVIADFLWSANSESDLAVVNEVFGVEEVEVIKQLMLAAMFDEVEDVSQANALLKSFTL
jgi:hypothetical protein